MLIAFTVSATCCVLLPTATEEELFWAWALECSAVKSVYWASVSEHSTMRTETDTQGRTLREYEQRTWQGLIGVARFPDAVRCRSLSVRDANEQDEHKTAADWIRQSEPRFMSRDAQPGDAVIVTGRGMTRVVPGSAFAETLPMVEAFDRPPPPKYPIPLFGSWCIVNRQIVRLDPDGAGLLKVSVEGQPIVYVFRVSQTGIAPVRHEVVSSGRVVQRTVFDSMQDIPGTDVRTQRTFRVFVQESNFVAPPSAQREDGLVCMGNWTVTNVLAMGETPDSMFALDFPAEAGSGTTVPRAVMVDDVQPVAGSALLAGVQQDQNAKWYVVGGVATLTIVGVGLWKWRQRRTSAGSAKGA